MRRLTVKERILLHLFDYSRFEESYEAPFETTQAGIAKAVGIRVSHVPENVRPLQAEGSVEERMRHTIRQESRRKVYFLTQKGRQQVAALRASLLKEEVRFERDTGETTVMPLMKVYHEERRGSSLLQLVEESNSKGAIAQAVEVEVTPLTDFSQEAPRVDRFYGRKRELDAVLRAIGEKPIVVVTGFAGIGKTTLGAKVLETLRGSHPIFWRQVRPWDTTTDLASRLAAFLKALGRTGLHTLFSMSGARELSRIEDLLAADFVNLRAVLFFDDVHHASEDAEAFLSMLARVLKSQKGTSAVFLSRISPRFYSRREVRLEGSVVEVGLEALDRKSSAALLLDAGVSLASVRQLARASGGNPLFLRLFAAGSETGATATGWDTVATYIAEQIEPSLSDPERDCLVAASFYDVPVPDQGLLLEGRGDRRALVGLQHKGLLGQVGSGEYVLHDTLKDYFQQSLASSPKKVIGAKVVAWLSEQADQAAQRGDPQEGVAYLSNAAKLELDPIRWASLMERIGDLRLLMMDLAESEHALRSALAETTVPQAKARLHGKLGWALQYYVWRLDEADQEIDAGLALLPEDPTPEAVLLLARKSDIALFRMDFDGMDKAIRRAAEMADRLPSEGVIRGRVALARARLRNFDVTRFDFGAVEADCLTAVEAAQNAQNEWMLSVAYSELESALVRVGRIEDALAVHEKGARHTRASGHFNNQVTELGGHAGLLLNYIGDFERAEGLLQEKLELAKRHGIVWNFLETYREFAELLRLQRRYEEARESLEYFLQMTSGGELYRLSVSWWSGGGRLNDLTLMARLCAQCGDVVASRAYLDQAYDLARGRPPEMSAFELAWAEAAIHVAKGQFTEADTSYRRALGHPPHLVRRRMFHEDESLAECMLEFGRFLISRGDESRARAVLSAALAIFARRSMKPLEREAHEALKSLSP